MDYGVAMLAKRYLIVNDAFCFHDRAAPRTLVDRVSKGVWDTPFLVELLDHYEKIYLILQSIEDHSSFENWLATFSKKEQAKIHYVKYGVRKKTKDDIHQYLKNQGFVIELPKHLQASYTTFDLYKHITFPETFVMDKERHIIVNPGFEKAQTFANLQHQRKQKNTNPWFPT